MAISTERVWGGLKTEAKSWLFTFISLKETDQRAGWQKLVI